MELVQNRNKKAKAEKAVIRTTAEKGVLVTPPVERGVVHITLNVGKGKDAAEIPIPLMVAKSPLISTLFATTLGEDKDAVEIDVPDPRIKAPLLTKIKNIFVRLYALLKPEERVSDASYESLTAARKKALVEQLLKLEIIQKLSHDEIADMLYAANYLGANLLLDAMAWQYAGVLRQIFEKSGLQAYDCSGAVEPIFSKRLKGDGIVSVLLPQISQYYFLRYKEDPDGFLGIAMKDRTKTTIPLETLVAYQLIPKTIIDGFPHLTTDPNALDKSGWSALSYALKELNKQEEDFNDFESEYQYAARALLKLRLESGKWIDVTLESRNSPITRAVLTSDIINLRAVVCAGRSHEGSALYRKSFSQLLTNSLYNAVVALDKGDMIKTLIAFPEVDLETIKYYRSQPLDTGLAEAFDEEIRKRKEHEAKGKGAAARGGAK